MILRTLGLAFVATAGMAWHAAAGDVASVEILGFSADGKVFAFEEYGIQDGSGFPYANRFYINTTTDEFVAGSPVRVRLDDESQTLETARQQARAGGEAIVPAAELAANRGFTAGYNPVTEYSADPHRMSVNPRPVFPPIDGTLEFRVEEIPLEPAENCENLGDAKGFRLLRINPEAGGQTVMVHEDTSIPKSRGCPQAYRIGAVQTFHPEGGQPVFAVLIATRTFGFEGPDYRWMAVVGKL